MVPARMIGFRSTTSGRNGSGARLSHQTKARLSASETATSAKIVGDSQGTRVPPEVSAMRIKVAAAIISAAPTISSWCGRSWRGSRFMAWWVSSAANSPNGTLSQKINDQCRYWAMMPPSAGPATPATIQDVPI